MKTSFTYGPSNADPELFEFNFYAVCTKQEAMYLSDLIQGMYARPASKQATALTGRVVTPEIVEHVDTSKYRRTQP